ncbi:MAG: hypothetical protein HYS70_03375 [Nitrospinae bacterium]|nr:hypothetical protein [Nitrospinota bacterium]
MEVKLKEAMEAALLGDWAKVETGYLSLRDPDRQRKNDSGEMSALAADLLDLRSLRWKDRDQYLAAQRESLKIARDPALERLVLKRLREDELNEADRLLREDRSIKIGKFYNIFAYNLNIINGFGLADLATVPFGALPKIGERAFSFLGDFQRFFRELDQIDPRERKALHLYDTFLRKWPQSKEAATAEARAERLRQKMDQYLFQRELRRAQEALKEGETHQSLYYSRKALALRPGSRKAHQGLRATEEKEKSFQEKLRQTEAVSDKGIELQQPPEVQREYEEILYALTARDKKRLRELSERFSQKHGDNPLADEAKEALALAYQWEGNPQGSRQVLESLAAEKRGSNMALRAQALLKDPGYDPFATFEALKKGENRSTLEYIILGKRLELNWDLENRDYFDVARDSLGLTNRLRKLNPNGMLRRTFDLVVLRKSLNNSALIAMGEFYLANHPSAEKSAEVHRVLAEAYEKKRDYHRARLHYQKAGQPSPEKMKELEEKAAESLLHLARKSRDEGEKTFYHSSLLQLYPSSDVAKKMLAQEKGGGDKSSMEETSLGRAPEALLPKALKDLPLPKEEWVSKAYLKSHPFLYGPQGLNLKVELFDDDISNGELAKKGIAFPTPDRLKIAYRMADDRLKEREYPVKEDLLARFSALLWEANYEAGEEGKKGLDGGLIKLLTQYEERGLFNLSSTGFHFGSLPGLIPPSGQKRDSRLKVELELLTPDQESSLDSDDRSPMIMGSKTHPLPGLLVNLDVKGNRDKDQPDQFELLGRPVSMKGEVRNRDYVFDYRFWENNQLALGKIYYSPWDTQGTMGLGTKGPTGELVFPVPFLKKHFPLVIDIKGQANGIRLLPVIMDPGISDEELYRD